MPDDRKCTECGKSNMVLVDGFCLGCAIEVKISEFPEFEQPYSLTQTGINDTTIGLLKELMSRVKNWEPNSPCNDDSGEWEKYETKYDSFIKFFDNNSHATPAIEELVEGLLSRGFEVMLLKDRDGHYVVRRNRKQGFGLSLLTALTELLEKVENG